MKLSARLGELPSFQMPCFAINRHGKAEVRSMSSLKSKGPERRRKKRKTKSKHFRIASMIDSTVRPSFFGRSSFIHRSFFVLHLVSACFKDLNLIYGPLGVPFIICASSSPFSTISDLISSRKANFNRSIVS